MKQVAGILAHRFSEPEILFDEFHAPEFARARLNFYLPKLYNQESDLVVVVICADYGKKEWCGLEWDATFDLIQKHREGMVMLANFGGATIDGLYNGAGFYRLDGKTPHEFANAILERLAVNEAKPRDYYNLPSPASGPAAAAATIAGAPATAGGTTSQIPSARSDQSASIIRQTFFCEYEALHGRERPLESLSRELQDEKRRGVIIGGIGGMGKTAFAYHFCSANRVSDTFEFVLGASAKESHLNVGVLDAPVSRSERTDRGPHTVESYLYEVAAQIGITAPAARMGKKVEEDIERAVGGSRCLFLLDNLETLDETADALELLYRLCRLPRRKFIVTARAVPPGLPSHVAPLKLPRLDPEPSKALVVDLLERLRRMSGTTHQFGSTAIESVTDRACGHPLALRLLTGKLHWEGENAIAEMSEMRPQEDDGAWTTELLKFVFNEAFLATFFGEVAVKVACMVAAYPKGIRERLLARAFAPDDDPSTKAAYALALQKLRSTFCIDTQPSASGSVLTMHPLTREFFAAYRAENATSAPQ